MYKRVICLALAAAVMVLFPFHSAAEDDAPTDEVGLAAPSAILTDAASGKVLYEKASHERRPCASITKVMTLCLVFEAIEQGKLDYDTMVTTSPMAAAQDGSDIWLVEGEQMSVDDLLKAVIIVSANDAAVALAEAVCSTEDAFVAKMNEKAKQLGMNDTEFKNCNGLDEEGHLTSAYDVAIMSRELIRHENVFDYTCVWLDYIRDGATQLVNTNRLVKSYSGLTGLKTGTTSLAGACISATARRGEVSLIAVVLGDKTTDMRFSDAEKLLDYGFSAFVSVTPEAPSDLPQSIPVKNGMKEFTAVSCTPDRSFLVNCADKDNITLEATTAEELEAPVNKGQRVGSVVYKCSGQTLGEFPVTVSDDVKRINFADVFIILLDKILGR